MTRNRRFKRLDRCAVSRRIQRRRRLRIEALEHRMVLSTFTVVNTNDAGAGSLRQAIVDSIHDPDPDADVIDASAIAGTIVLTSPLDDLTTDVTINGPGAQSLTVLRSSDAEIGEFRIFTVASSATVAINGLNVSGGIIRGKNSFGGGIYNAGNLTLANIRVSGNHVVAVGDLNSPEDYSGGGGIYNSNQAILVLVDSLVTGNRTLTDADPTQYQSLARVGWYSHGGGVLNEGELTLSGSTVANNRTGTKMSRGGGIANLESGKVLLVDSIVDSNRTEAGKSTGGGIANLGQMTVVGSDIGNNRTAEVNELDQAHGGGIFNTGTLTMSDSTVSGNVSAGGRSAGGGIANSGTATLTDTLVINNRVRKKRLAFYYDGGGIHSFGNLTITGGAVRDNTGHGIHAGGSVTITDAYIEGNTAFGMRNSGDAVVTDSSVADNGASGFFVDPTRIAFAPLNTLKLLRVTIRGNQGDGVINRGDLELVESTVSGNAGRGVKNISQYEAGWRYNFGGLSTLIDSQIAGNQGGGIKNVGTLAMMQLSDVIITGNRSEHGAGISNSGGMLLLESSVEDNYADAGGGGIVNSGYLTIAKSTIRDNRAVQEGGGISNGGELLIEESSIVRNQTFGQGGAGGGVANSDIAILRNSLVRGNRTAGESAPGGGIFNSEGSDLTLDRVTLTDNQTLGDQAHGAGIAALGTNRYVCGLAGNPPAPVHCLDDGLVTVVDSTISGNSAQGAGSMGGGIFIGQGAREELPGGVVALVNATVSQNAADDGGGLFNHESGQLAITNSTIVGNRAGIRHDGGGSGGGVFNQPGGDFELKNTIVADNVRETASGTETYVADDIGGTAQGSFNLIGDATTSGGLVDGVDDNLVGHDPRLGPLQDNGGATMTHAPLPDSPAINEGDNGLALDEQSQPLQADQRGAPRVFGGSVDIGAYEFLDTLTVDTLIDEDNHDVTPGDDVSLREALQYVGLQGTVQFADSLTGEILLEYGQLRVAQDVTVIGSGAEQLTINADGQSRVFSIDPHVDAGISGLTVTGGLSRVGGGISNLGNLNLTEMVVTGNAAELGGGVSNYGSLIVTESEISHNSAELDGGGIRSTGDQSEVSAIDVTFSHNSAANGGGIYNSDGAFSLSEGVVDNNSAVSGAGVWNDGQLTIEDTIVSSNTAASRGGGVANFGRATFTVTTVSQNTAVAGGGLYNWEGSLVVRDSLLAHNSASFGGGIYSSASGSPGAATLNVANSTVSTNTADLGGGLYTGALGASVTKLTNSTLTANRINASAMEGGGGIYSESVTLLNNTIVAGNVHHTLGPDDVAGSLDPDSSHNLIGIDRELFGISHGSGGNIVGTTDVPIDPLLGPLEENGGPTLTHALLPGSQAINAGDKLLAVDEMNQPLLNDQRGVGFPRLVTDTVDIGSYEFPNLAPDAVDDFFAGDEDTLLAGNVLDNEVDANGDQLTVDTTPLAAPSHGTLVLNADGTFTYTPDENFNGEDSFSYRVHDPDGLTDTANVKIAINAINDFPVVTVPPPQTTPEDVPVVITGIAVADVDVGESAGELIVTLVVSSGVLTVAEEVPDGLASSQIDSNNTSQVVLTGMPEAINATLDSGVTYQGITDFHGDDWLRVEANDQGNTGAGGVNITGSTVLIQVLSPQQQVHNIGDWIDELIDEEVLNTGQANSLLSELKLNGNARAVANRIEAFMHHVQSLVEEGVLTEEEGQQLIDGALDLLTSWNVINEL